MENEMEVWQSKKLVLAIVMIFMTIALMIYLDHSGKQKKVITVTPIQHIKIKQEEKAKEKKQEIEQKQIREQIPEPTRISNVQATKTGLKLLKNKKIPELKGDINGYLISYLMAIKGKNGVLAVYERNTAEVIGQMEMGKKRPIRWLRFLPKIKVDKYSKRTRNITTDLPKNVRKSFTQTIKKQNGSGAYYFLVMLPEQQEAHFIGLLAEALKQQGYSYSELDKVSFKYRVNNKQMLLEIQHIEKNSKKIAINTSVIWS